MSERNTAILPPPFDEIEELVGYANAINIAQILGWGWLYIPSVDTLLREQRYCQIVQDYFEKGLRTRDIARKYGVSESTVRNYIRTEREKKGGK